MSATETRSTAEIADKGREYYRRVIEPQLTPADHGKYIAVAVDHSDFAIARKAIDAIQLIMARYTGGLMHLERAGYPAAFRLRRFR